MLYLLQMGLSKVLTTLLLQIQNSWKLSLLKLPPCCVPACNIVTSSTVTSTVTPDCNTVISSLDYSGLHTSAVLPAPSANAALPPHSRLQTSCLPSAHSVFSPSAPSPPPLAPSCPTPPASSYHLTPSGFLNGILVVSESGTLNCFTFFRPILLTLSVSRNLILTHLSLSGSLDSLLCDLIAPTPGLAFTLMMPRT